MINVKVYNGSNNELPKYETPGSAGMDVRADLLHPETLLPGKSMIVPTGLFVEIPGARILHGVRRGRGRPQSQSRHGDALPGLRQGGHIQA